MYSFHMFSLLTGTNLTNFQFKMQIMEKSNHDISQKYLPRINLILQFYKNKRMSETCDTD